MTQGLGEFPKHGITSEPSHLSAFAELESTYRAEKGLAADRRLSCTATVCGDVLIDVPPESQVHRQVVRKGLDVRTFIVDPVVRLHYVEVTPPELASPTGDLARLFEALEREWQLTGLEADLEVIRALQPALEAGKYGVTVAVHEGRQVVAVWPGLHETAYGVAIDVGSTTIAGHLANLADGAVLASNGVMNPQIRFGEDLMSRVSYAMMHPEGAGEMTAAVRKALDGLIATLAMRAGIKRVEILELAIVGNPIMHHLLLGIDPTPLGGAPFALATDRAVRTTAAALGLRAHPGARVYVLPCIAGHVGADTAGVILAEEPHEADRMTLVVDVGTNAEIVLGDKRRLLAASSPTGPAFEGAQISGGQRAAPGAIERVRIDRDTLEPRFRVIGVDAWSDEPAFAAAVAEHRHHRDLRLGDHRGRGRAVPGRRRDRGRRHRRRARGRTPRVVPDGRTFSYILHAGGEGRPPARASRSPRTTSGRSSWPRPRSMPASGCSWTSSRSRRSTRSGWPAHSAARSTRSTRWSSASSPTATSAHVRSAGNAAGTGRAHRAPVGRARGPRSRASSGASRRSRPRSSRASRSISSRRWPSRTRPPPSPTWRASSTLPARARRGERRRAATPGTSGDDAARWRSGRREDRLMEDTQRRRSGGASRPPGAAGAPMPSTSRS